MPFSIADILETKHSGNNARRTRSAAYFNEQSNTGTRSPASMLAYNSPQIFKRDD
jgi:hypothetical protein